MSRAARSESHNVFSQTYLTIHSLNLHRKTTVHEVHILQPCLLKETFAAVLEYVYMLYHNAA